MVRHELGEALERAFTNQRTTIRLGLARIAEHTSLDFIATCFVDRPRLLNQGELERGATAVGVRLSDWRDQPVVDAADWIDIESDWINTQRRFTSDAASTFSAITDFQSLGQVGLRLEF